MANREYRSQKKLFRTEVAGKVGSGRLFDERPVTLEPVECLGMPFESKGAGRSCHTKVVMSRIHRSALLLRRIECFDGETSRSL